MKYVVIKFEKGRKPFPITDGTPATIAFFNSEDEALAKAERMENTHGGCVYEVYRFCEHSNYAPFEAFADSMLEIGTHCQRERWFDVDVTVTRRVKAKNKWAAQSAAMKEIQSDNFPCGDLRAHNAREVK